MRDIKKYALEFKDTYPTNKYEKTKDGPDLYRKLQKVRNAYIDPESNDTELTPKRIKDLEEIPYWSWDNNHIFKAKKFLKLLEEYLIKNKKLPPRGLVVDGINLESMMNDWRRTKNDPKYSSSKVPIEYIDQMESLPYYYHNPQEYKLSVFNLIIEDIYNVALNLNILIHLKVI